MLLTTSVCTFFVTNISKSISDIFSLRITVRNTGIHHFSQYGSKTRNKVSGYVLQRSNWISFFRICLLDYSMHDVKTKKITSPPRDGARIRWWTRYNSSDWISRRRVAVSSAVNTSCSICGVKQKKSSSRTSEFPRIPGFRNIFEFLMSIIWMRERKNRTLQFIFRNWFTNIVVIVNDILWLLPINIYRFLFFSSFYATIVSWTNILENASCYR